MFAFAAGLLAVVALGASEFQQKKSDNGLVVELSVVGPLQEGNDVKVDINVRDESGNPITGLNPSAWMSLRAADGKSDRDRCTAKVATFTAGNLFVRPEVDLNVYHVLAMNADGTITVVDPRFGFGGTQLLALVELPAPGEDWTLSKDGDLLFISIPTKNQVAVIDTSRWTIQRTIDVGPKPTRIVLQPDGRYVWVVTTAGVTVLDGNRSRQIATSSPPSDIVLTDDSRFAIVTHGKSASIIATESLERIGMVRTDASITTADYSNLSRLAYLAGTDDVVYVAQPSTGSIVGTMKVMPGAKHLRIAPGGRFGFIVNKDKGAVQIFDTKTNRVIQQAKVDSSPDRVFFSDQLAYIRHTDSAIVLMIPLDQIGTPEAAVPVIDFPAGQKAFREGAPFGPADGIVRAPGANAVLVAHPADRAIYYYKEGMAAPMGHFANYSRQPRAVLVLDRSLQERGAGKFQTRARLGPPGLYDVAVFVNSPRIVTCFELPVAESAEGREARRGGIEVQHLKSAQSATAGQPVRITFRLVDKSTRQSKGGLDDVVVMAMSVGTWHTRQTAVARHDGSYELTFTPPATGVYYLYVQCHSLGLAIENPQYLLLTVKV